jgi:transcription antitermination factor NusG
MNQPNTEPWHVLRVKSHFERVVEKRLNHLGLETIVPVQKQWSRRTDRRKMLDVVLFAGYVFVNTDYARRNEVFLAGREVLGFLHHDGKPALLRQHELSLIRRLTEVGSPVEVLSSPPAHGDQVEIVSGPLAGYSGIVKELSGRQRVLLHISGLQCMAQVELKLTEIRKR